MAQQMEDIDMDVELDDDYDIEVETDDDIEEAAPNTEQEDQAIAAVNRAYFHMRRIQENKIRTDINELVRVTVGEDKVPTAGSSEQGMAARNQRAVEVEMERQVASDSGLEGHAWDEATKKRLKLAVDAFRLCCERARDARTIFVQAIRKGRQVRDDSEDYQIAIRQGAFAEMLVKKEDAAMNEAENKVIASLKTRNCALIALNGSTLAAKRIVSHKVIALCGTLKQMKASIMVPGYNLVYDEVMANQ